jgi:hypothetical protein
MARFNRTPKGIDLHLDAPEYAVLERVPALVGSIGAGQSDPAMIRLDPPVHPGDERASNEFARLAGADVSQGRSDDTDVFERTLRSGGADGELSLEEAAAWVRTLGTARVALIARSGREFDDDAFAAADRADPDILLVDYLGMLQDELVTLLLTDLPPGSESL